MDGEMIETLMVLLALNGIRSAFVELASLRHAVLDATPGSRGRDHALVGMIILGKSGSWKYPAPPHRVHHDG
jgi:hypothetical protein